MGTLDEEVRRELDGLRAAGLYRRLRRGDGAPGARGTLDGKAVVVFGSNNYLEMTCHPAVRQGAADAAMEIGTGSSGSRLTSGNLALHEELEAELAALKGSEAAIVFGTGYSAGVGTITALVRDGDLLLSDALNHASLIDGCRLSSAEVRVYRHNDVEHTRSLLADRGRFRRCLIVTDTIFSMDGDIAPLPEIRRVCDEHDAWLMVDDAHGTGVLGANGTGVIEHFGMDSSGIIQMGTLSKAVGSEGGFVAGSSVLIDYLRNRARPFIFSTAPAPPSMAAALAAVRIISTDRERRERLRANGDRLRALLRSAGFNVPDGVTPIVPLFLGSPDTACRVAESLFERGYYVPAIRPPSVPEGTARLRFSVTSGHTDSEIDGVASALADVLNCDSLS